MKKAIFCDRDGVLLLETGNYNYNVNKIEINEGAVEALKFFSQKGFLIIVITNQSGVAKGIYTQKHVKQVHRVIKDFFSSEGVKITDFFYCPHHPDVSRCLCRKPDSIMLEKAIALYNIDPDESYFIGDMQRDCDAGEKAGVKTILVNPNDDLSNYLHLIN
jgi:D-glycero-D-manno-heptose 1,7-bisphosphate phosphatase